MPHKDLKLRQEYQREYRRLHADMRAARRPNDDRLKNANRRAAMYGAPGVLSLQDIRAVMAKSSCHYCGGTHLLGIDHVRPLTSGGTNTTDNLVVCCRSCNSSKYRSERPHLWSRVYSACCICGTNERKHCARGCCFRCYQARYKRKRKASPVPPQPPQEPSLPRP